MAEQENQPSSKDKYSAIEQQLRATVQQLQASEQQLRASEQKIRKMEQNWRESFNSLDEVMILIDSDFKIEKMNANGLKLIGKSEKDVVGKKCYEVLHRLNAPTEGCPLKKSLRTKKAESTDLFEEHFGRHFSISSSPIIDEKGKIVRFIDLMRDITERKQVEAERSIAYDSLHSSVNGVIITDIEGRITYSNPSALRMFEYETVDEVKGKPASGLFVTDKVQKFSDVKAIIDQVEGLTDEFCVRRKDGSEFDVEVCSSVVTDEKGTVVGRMASFVDISKRKRAEEALKAANQQLRAHEQQLRAANQQLQAGEQQIKAANQHLRASEQQLKAANQQLQAANQHLEAANQQLRANEEELRKLNRDLGERVKELNCLFGLSHLVDQRDITLEEIFKGLLELIPPGWQYPEITAARIIFKGRRFKTGNFRKTTWLQSADIKVHGRKAGTIEVCYLKKGPVIDEGPFLREERNLLNTLAERMGNITERKLAEKALGAANQQLNASNQQLQASEQQLKAANQQLKANEQQLRAANQQLQASEQQLRANNRQLQAEVTERKKAEEKIKTSLREKEVLLKEIHHRVKNNMQVISSILNLQSKYVKDKQALEIFKNGQSRIRSMALVHEKLYESEDLANIDFAEYVRSITHYLFGLHEISPLIRLNIDIKGVLLDVNTAVPCSLIINELLSNSLKYAFPGEREGKICVGLYSDKGNKFTLIVKDDGIGFPKDTDFRKTESLGMQLVIMLVEQLGGTIELDKSKGTRFTIKFETPKLGGATK
jgi:PAS domain S-box-containing protein